MKRVFMNMVVCAAVAMLATTARAADDPEASEDAKAPATESVQAADAAGTDAKAPEADAAAPADEEAKPEADAAATDDKAPEADPSAPAADAKPAAEEAAPAADAAGTDDKAPAADAAAPAAEAAPAADSAAKAKSKDGDKKKKNTAGDTAAQLGAANVVAVGGERSPFFVTGSFSFRTPVISDADPRNDRWINYRLGAGFTLFKGGILTAGLTLQHRFVAQGGQLPDGLPAGTIDFSQFDQSVNDSGFRLGNLGLGFLYFHGTKLEIGEFSRNITLIHRGALQLPTSRDSQNQAFYLGLSALTTARTAVYKQLYMNLTGFASWRGHEFSTTAGIPGVPLPRFAVVGQIALEYLFNLGSAGFLTVGGDISGSQTINYPSRDPLDSGTADGTFVRPGYGYDFYVAYIPLPFLTASVAWEQGGNVIRNGVVNTFFFHRDETRLAFTVAARY